MEERRVGETEQGWSEAPLTEMAQSGRYSAWSTEEWDFDRAATEKVERMFRCLNRALYNGRESGFTQTDRECHEWSSTFPHFQVQSEHLFDVMDDGTEVADPIYREDSSSTTTGRSTHHSNSDSNGLAVVGRHIEPVILSDTPEEAALREEILAQHGHLEEYLAFDCSAENGMKGSKRRFEGAQTVQCPTVTPEAGLQQIVLGQLLDILWSEVATVLEPLLVAARDRALIAQSSGQSMRTSLATSHNSSPHGSHLVLPGLPHPLSPSTAQDSTHNHNLQYYGFKSATSSPEAPPILPRLAPPPRPPLSGLMMIKPLSLRHRNISLLSQTDGEEEMLARLSFHNHTQQVAALPEATGLTFHQSHSRHNYTSAFPSTPPGGGPSLSSYRHTLSSRTGLATASRRPLQLRPIDNPPALERMRTHVRGFRVPVGGVGLSPPPTAGGGVAPVSVAVGGILGSGHVRNNQLPPLDAGAIPLTDRSPPVVRGSKSTFSQRSSNSELQEYRKQQQLSGTTRPLDIRPNTSSTHFRAESGKLLGVKKLSDVGSHGGGGMKIVGHATGVSYSNSAVTGATGGEGGVISGGRTELPYSIAETEEEDSGTLNITGHSSALLKSKPRSLNDNRVKHRGHGR